MIDVVANKVVVHPLVLLSVVDHFNRMGKIGNQKRVVGVLLGSWRPKGVLDVSNSFAGEYRWAKRSAQMAEAVLAILETLTSSTRCHSVIDLKELN
ncbi:26S proteasome non-ATPase regulatory subunit 7 [Homalodisca vitripennis]|nr:26S proteasome non-ATPase regulatory subunit 7 [Homalodisca vitripennis]KAG8332078.1 26S proteasome non-ATPase regulatory subunit 7 [Homalodisca vitripennis]